LQGRVRHQARPRVQVGESADALPRSRLTRRLPGCQRAESERSESSDSERSEPSDSERSEPIDNERSEPSDSERSELSEREFAARGGVRPARCEWVHLALGHPRRRRPEGERGVQGHRGA